MRKKELVRCVSFLHDGDVTQLRRANSARRLKNPPIVFCALVKMAAPVRRGAWQKERL